jgi:hypothetical protein
MERMKTAMLGLVALMATLPALAQYNLLSPTPLAQQHAQITDGLQRSPGFDTCAVWLQAHNGYSAQAREQDIWLSAFAQGFAATRNGSINENNPFEQLKHLRDMLTKVCQAENPDEESLRLVDIVSYALFYDKK